MVLLKGLFESRVMTLGHVAMLHFDGRKEAAMKRLQKIKAAGFISERKHRVNEPAPLFLARKGLDLLREHGVLAEYPSFGLPALEKRARVSDLPLHYKLDDAMAMSPTATLSSAATVVVGARISKSGNAMPQAGDLAGEASPVAPGANGIDIRIDSVLGAR